MACATSAVFITRASGGARASPPSAASATASSSPSAPSPRASSLGPVASSRFLLYVEYGSNDATADARREEPQLRLSDPAPRIAGSVTPRASAVGITDEHRHEPPRADGRVHATRSVTLPLPRADPGRRTTVVHAAVSWDCSQDSPRNRRSSEVEVMGLEPTTSTLRTWRPSSSRRDSVSWRRTRLLRRPRGALESGLSSQSVDDG